MTNEDRRTALGEMIGRRRRALRLRVKDAAERGGISIGAWGRAERGDTTSGLTLSGVDLALGWAENASEDYLRDGTSPRERDAGGTMPNNQGDNRASEERPKHVGLPGSDSAPPDTEAPSYEIIPGVWVTTDDPDFVTMTAEERLARMQDRSLRGWEGP